MIEPNTSLGGRYRVDQLLGRGGMAEVYRGTDTVLGRTVAIKVLSSAYADDEGFVDRFRREAQAAAKINHPNVVGVYDTGSDGSAHYIVMEYVSGETLADVVARGGRLPPDQAARIAAQAAQGLLVAHEEGLVHRDIKPGNIMITDSGEVKVMDFGIARTLSAQTVTQTATVLGTANYLSPEQARGERLDRRSDTYSLGVVLYEMLTGRPPFAGDSPVAAAYKHVNEEPVPPREVVSDVPEPIQAVVLKAMAKDPEARYQSAADMRADLERAAGGLPVAAAAAATEPLAAEGTAVLPPAAEVTPTRAYAPPPPPRRWWPALLAAMLLAAAIIPAIVLLSGTSEEAGQGPTGQPARSPQETATQTTAPPTTPPPTTPPPSTVPPPTVAPTTVEGAATQISGLLTQGLGAGLISEKAENDVEHGVEEALREYGKGDLDKALENISEVKDKLSEMVDKGELDPGLADQLGGALDDLAALMQASPPPEEE